MRFLVCSREEVEALLPFAEKHVIISIRTPRDPHEAKLPECSSTLGVLHLQFHDLDEVPTQHIPEKLLGMAESDRDGAFYRVDPRDLFDDEKADRVVAFAREHAVDCELAIVHCDAGISRSPAVAAALARTVFDQEDAEFFRQYYPNRRVYKKIIEAYGRVR